MLFLKRIFSFIKNYPGILYSLLLIIVIPSALFYNTLFTAKSFQKNIDTNLQTKALIVEDIFSIFASDIFSKPEILQEKIKKITEENSEITNLRVMKEKEGGNFQVVASQNPEEIGNLFSEVSLNISWSQNQSIANLIGSKDERFWEVIKPIYNNDTEEKIGLVSMALSLKQPDALIVESLYRSYFIVILAIMLSLFLIIQHTRLFGYVVLSKKLQEVDKMKDNFIRMTTHELQTPITNIRAYSHVLKEEMDSLSDEERKEHLFRIESSAKNLSELIYDILEVSRIEQGRLDFTYKQIFPAGIINEVVQELKLKADQKYLKLTIDISEHQACINANPLRLKQIITNLVENAIKYTPKGEIKIAMNVDEQKNECIISIKDTGLGMSAEHSKRLFERFYRIKTRNTAEIAGTGLGLWITKQLCEKMKGKIFVESMEGIGSKFTIIFPLTKFKDLI
ncbi:HAMP domain-containing histidine kinase [Candidatus Parcubacteria bacterium]|jgi:signal transduction histidine kinase|nr:HAMP domain-containing histidine kinase [Candidatus Parcubacteria bacterium]